MFISEIMIISAKIDGYSRNLLSCLFFQGDFYWACTSIIAETLDKLAHCLKKNQNVSF